MDPTIPSPPGVTPGAPPGANPTPPPGMSQDQFQALTSLASFLKQQASAPPSGWEHDGSAGYRWTGPTTGMAADFGEGSRPSDGYHPTPSFDGSYTAPAVPDFTSMLTSLFSPQNGAQNKGQAAATPQGQAAAPQGSPISALMQAGGASR